MRLIKGLCEWEGFEGMDRARLELASTSVVLSSSAPLMVLRRWMKFDRQYAQLLT